jgi:hypothetical protein
MASGHLRLVSRDKYERDLSAVDEIIELPVQVVDALRSNRFDVAPSARLIMHYLANDFATFAF